MSKIETVRVLNDAARGGFMVINADDFDPEVHEIVGGSSSSGIPTDPLEIDTMERKEVVALLKAHGDEAPSGKIGDLRDKLKRAMFVNV